MRIDKDNYYLNIAEIIATRSTCLRRPYGTMIVNRDEIISTGYNGTPRGEDNCCDIEKCYYKDHAEQNAINSATRKDMQGATLYLACLDKDINTAPCNMCDRMIRNAGITRIVTRAGAF